MTKVKVVYIVIGVLIICQLTVFANNGEYVRQNTKSTNRVEFSKCTNCKISEEVMNSAVPSGKVDSSEDLVINAKAGVYYRLNITEGDKGLNTGDIDITYDSVKVSIYNNDGVYVGGNDTYFSAEGGLPSGVYYITALEDTSVRFYNC